MGVTVACLKDMCCIACLENPDWMLELPPFFFCFLNKITAYSISEPVETVFYAFEQKVGKQETKGSTSFVYSEAHCVFFTEDKENASQHPYFDGGEALGFGGVGVDVVEDVDKDEEESDEQRHAPGDDVGRDEEGDPGDEDEEAGGEVVGDDVGHHVPRQVL